MYIKQTKLKAFTIVETLVCLLAITIMIAGPVTFMYKSYTYSQFIKARLVATGLSQEGIELATALRNYDTSTFISEANNCSDSCSIDWIWSDNDSHPVLATCSGEGCRLKKKDPNQLFGVSGDTETDFYRSLKFTANGTDSYTLESTVYAYIDTIKVSVTLKKIIFNIDVK
jgi:type II secretory pathway pseudopilin PulG